MVVIPLLGGACVLRAAYGGPRSGRKGRGPRKRKVNWRIKRIVRASLQLCLWVKKKVGIMTYDVLGAGALDYMPCHYGASKLNFRGPKRVLGGADGMEPYVAFLGGTQTFGKYIEQPYPLKVEHLTGVASVNFGQINAGPDVFFKEQVVLKAAHKARATVVEVMGASNMSNLIYKVHQRRNDRFLRATVQLRELYPEVDFSQFNFTNHMLLYLQARDPKRFQIVLRVLQRTWLRKMRLLLKRLGGQVILLRIAEDTRKDGRASVWHKSFGPAFVTDGMIESLSELVCDFVDVSCVPVKAQEGGEGLVCRSIEDEAAKRIAGPHSHTEIAKALLPVLDRVI